MKRNKRIEPNEPCGGRSYYRRRSANKSKNGKKGGANTKSKVKSISSKFRTKSDKNSLERENREKEANPAQAKKMKFVV